MIKQNKTNYINKVWEVHRKSKFKKKKKKYKKSFITEKMSEKIGKSSGNGINLTMPPMKVAVIGAGLVCAIIDSVESFISFKCRYNTVIPA